MLTFDSSIILINAVYFKGDWERKFNWTIESDVIEVNEGGCEAAGVASKKIPIFIKWKFAFIQSDSFD